MHFWFVTFDSEPFVTLLQHIRYVEYYHCESAATFPMLDYFHVANAGWFAISIMTLSSPLFHRASFLGQRGFIICVTNHPISCLESCVSSHLLGIYGETRDKKTWVFLRVGTIYKITQRNATPKSRTLGTGLFTFARWRHKLMQI